jgi:heme/copper-type cytochrome/quinol oxidase subunit 2
VLLSGAVLIIVGVFIILFILIRRYKRKQRLSEESPREQDINGEQVTQPIEVSTMAQPTVGYSAIDVPLQGSFYSLCFSFWTLD